MSIVWIILGIIALIFLAFFSKKGRNAIWGGLTIGVIVGLIIALVYLFGGRGFAWQILIEAVIIGTLAGGGAELLGLAGKKK